MASPSGEPEWANPREIVRTIVTMSQMCRRKPNMPLRFWSSQTFFLIPERRAKNEILAGSKMGGIHLSSERQREILVGLALPNDPQHRRLIMSIAGVLSKLSIYIFWVGDRIQVEPELPETKMSP